MKNEFLLVCSLSLAAVGLASPTRADVIWDVNGTFSDGGTLKGYLDINSYGYIEKYSLTSTAGSVLGGRVYDLHDGFVDVYGNTIDFFFGGYDNVLQLTFQHSLATPGYDAILTAGSFECRDSWSCPATTDARFVTFGAATPEPKIWALMLLGFGGMALRRRRASRAA